MFGVVCSLKLKKSSKSRTITVDFIYKVSVNISGLSAISNILVVRAI